MDYEKLPTAYWLKQVDRLEASRAALAARDEVASSGRVIPGAPDLVYGTGRRLRAAVLFLDISAFSARPSETQREQDFMLRILTFFFTEMVRIAEEYGGTVEKNTGDGLMAYFEDNAGDPPTSGIKRALPCALTMFYAVQNAVNPVVVRTGLDAIQFRVGIETGWITIAKLGAARRFGSIAAVGTTANMASKMSSFAAPGDIVIGESAKLGLPIGWQIQFCTRIPGPSGWIYRLSGAEYPFYKYTGRWTGPR